MPDASREAHSVLVKRWLGAMVAGLLLAAAGGSALLLLDNGSTAVATDSGSSARQAPVAGDQDEERDEDRGHGPPPWAHSHAKAMHHGSGKAWKALSPGQRHNLMKRLSREHADGMKAFVDCVKAGRSDCEKPLPPGLAKRR